MKNEFPTMTGSDSYSLAILDVLRASQKPCAAYEIRKKLKEGHVILRDDEVLRYLRQLLVNKLVTYTHNKWAVPKETVAEPLKLNSINNSPVDDALAGNVSLTCPALPESQWNLFRRLCNYYLDCLLYTESPRITLSSRERTFSWNFIEQPIDWDQLHLKGDQFPIVLPSDPGTLNILKPKGQRSDCVLIGYPCALIVKDDECTVVPVFIQRMTVKIQQRCYLLQPDGPTMINQQWLDNHCRTGIDKKLICEHLGLSGVELDDEEEFAAAQTSGLSFGELLNRLKLWPSLTIKDQRAGHTSSRYETAAEGLYHWVVVASAKLKFSKALYKEIKQIAEHASDAELDSSALKYFFLPMEASLPNQHLPANESSWIAATALLSVDQEEAVTQGLAAPLTVITGPPGTGKSEVICSTIMNLTLRHNSVLLVSRNHQALDAVIPRINKLSKTGKLIVRGSQRGNKNCFNLDKAVDVILSSNWFDAENLARFQKKLDALKEMIDKRSILQRDLIEVHELQCQIDSNFNVLEVDRLSMPTVWRNDDQLKPWMKLPSKLKLEIDKLSALPSDSSWWISIIQRLFRFSRSHRFQRLSSKLVATSLLNRELAEAGQIDKNLGIWRKAIKIAEYFRLHEQLLERLSSYSEPSQLVNDIYLLWEKCTQQTVSCFECLNFLSRDQLLPEERELLANLRHVRAPMHQRNRERVIKATEKVLQYFPLWATSSLSVSSSLPLVAGCFDLLIIDEASQSDVPSFIPLLFRAKRAMVVGDPKQLCHISHLSERNNLTLMQAHQLSDYNVQRFTDPRTSAFHLAHNSPWNAKPIFLENHFRCHPEIAAYASETFYSSRLVVATLVDRLKTPTSYVAGCHWTHVDSTPPCNGNSSHASGEVQEIVNELKKLHKQNFNGTIGIITPFRRQANILQEEISKEIPSSYLEQSRCAVHTVHGFQGDERDVIFFSLAAGPEMATGTKNFIANNPNLFNVAVTRAKAMLHIFGHHEWSKTCGIDFIERMARFCENKSRGPSACAYESIWEEKLDIALKKAGIQTRPQFPIAGRRLDLAVITPAIKIDIEVDGQAYHTNAFGFRKADDHWRDQQLISLGWVVRRFWVWQLQEDMGKCVNEIVTIIKDSEK
jgi:very-short-patch-repair endonuclease/superfamily I DNA/RNA helicase